MYVMPSLDTVSGGSMFVVWASAVLSVVSSAGASCVSERYVDVVSDVGAVSGLCAAAS